jgi:uncharacterized protein (TIGR02444 family)
VDSSPSLWDFAVNLYTRPGVAALCLRLQDEYGVNVPLLLFARWLELRNQAMDLPAALNRVDRWHREYVEPLRELRRKMKVDFARELDLIAPVRNQIKDAELLAEKQELNWLAQLADDWHPTALDAGRNLRLYLAYLQVPEHLAAETLAILASPQADVV